MIANTHRFHGRSSLRFVSQRGQTVRGPQVSLRFVRNQRQSQYRVAVVVSRKTSKSAVVRNRIRRRLYEIVRKHAARIAEPYDLVFSVYSEEVAEMSHAWLQKVILGQLQKARVLVSPATQEADRGTIDDVLKHSAGKIHSSHRNSNRKGEAALTESERRKGKTLPGFAPPSNYKETNT